ncbi:hypothetical protein pb186bvf_003135 [Paramecium bursaria]
MYVVIETNKIKREESSQTYSILQVVQINARINQNYNFL